jgi:hypothetical protein
MWLQQKRTTTTDSALTISENQAECLCASSNEYSRRCGSSLNLTPSPPGAASKFSTPTR